MGRRGLNCDGVFSSGDLVKAFADGGYEAGPVPATARSSSLATDDVVRRDPIADTDSETAQQAEFVAAAQGAELELLATDQLFEEFEWANFEVEDQELLLAHV